MNILVIDGQGGKLGCQMVRSIAERYPDARLMAVGTNSAAAAAMAKAGACGGKPAYSRLPQGGYNNRPNRHSHSGFPLWRDNARNGGRRCPIRCGADTSACKQVRQYSGRRSGAVTDGSNIRRYGQARRRDARVNCILSTDGFSCTIGLCRSEDGAGTEVPLNKPCINTVFCDVMKASLSQKGSRRLFYAIWKELLS